MPLSKTGKKVYASMGKEYGKKKGRQIFYATMNKMDMSKKWEGPKPRGKCPMGGSPMVQRGEPCNGKFCR